MNFGKIYKNLINNFFKNTFKHFTTFWGKLKIIQKIGVLVFILAIIGGLVTLLYKFTSVTSQIDVIDVSICDKEVLENIISRINTEGETVSITSNNIVQALLKEDRIPEIVALLFDWLFERKFSKNEYQTITIADLERDFSFQLAIERTIAEHIRAINGVDNVELRIMWSKKELFASKQNPVSASLIIFPTPEKNITKNKIEEIQKIIQTVFEEPKDENIIIVDNNGEILNGIFNNNTPQNIKNENIIKYMILPYIAKVLYYNDPKGTNIPYLKSKFKEIPTINDMNDDNVINCQDYSLLFYALCKYHNIPVKIIYNSSQNHEFNQIEYDFGTPIYIEPQSSEDAIYNSIIKSVNVIDLLAIHKFILSITFPEYNREFNPYDWGDNEQSIGWAKPNLEILNYVIDNGKLPDNKTVLLRFINKKNHSIKRIVQMKRSRKRNR